MCKEAVNEISAGEDTREDRALFGSIFKHVVHAPASVDTIAYVLKKVGANMGADRCCIYKFTDPGTSSMCSLSHEWRADGIAPASDRGHAFDLAEFGEMDASIASGGDCMFADAAAVGGASRRWLEALGAKSMMATPLVVGGTAIGFAAFCFANVRPRGFAERMVSNMHTTADILLACRKLHERNAESEKAIRTMQDHLRFRADALAYALSKDDMKGLKDMLLRRLLELTDCDYIALHSVAGDHLMLDPDGKLDNCPGRCEACTFYKLMIPPVEDEEHVIELADAKGQSVAPLPRDCPARSLEVAVVHCDGKPWGGIALHYLDRQNQISDHDRISLKISANVLSLALERHSAAARLKAERDRVIESEKVRSYFFSSVSHDIRTPLNAIIGFSELLQAGDVPPEEARNNLKMIVSSGKALLQLVNDVLDISKMDLGKLEFSHEPMSVGEIVQETAMMFLPQTRDRNQTIVAEIPDMPRLMVDPHRFRQVLFNFVSNAVKYAGPCTIRISASYGDGVFRMAVSDDGRGVSAEKARRLMQPFVQADIKNRSEGCGLGLAICKRLVELAHGKISIETAPGKGFAIRIEFPADVAPGESAAGAERSPEPAAGACEQPGRVLVVDDSPVNRVVLKAILGKLGVGDIVLAQDGGAALEILKGDSAFDWVLTDMWMPVMDGSELVKNIRSDARLAHLKVCSVTADVEARDTYREQGFDSLLLKPVSIEGLKGLFAGSDPQGRGDVEAD